MSDNKSDSKLAHELDNKSQPELQSKYNYNYNYSIKQPMSVKACDVQKGDVVVINGRPCEIVCAQVSK